MLTTLVRPMFCLLTSSSISLFYSREATISLYVRRVLCVKMDTLLLPVVPSPNPFLSLAPELKQAIFSALPNASTLRSLVLTCSSFYRTFLDAETLIIKSILHTQIGSYLICDAIIVFESRTLEPYDNLTAIELLSSYAKKDLSRLSQTWKLRDALTIGGLHDDIEFFSRNFASSTLSINPVTGLDEPSPALLSSSESNRIKRTFYRYELFGNIFRQLDAIENVLVAPESPQGMFFSICAPWENEQLACVRDYLHDCLSLRMSSQNLWPEYL